MEWRTEPTNVEKLGDELWLGVKGQSNSEISCSLRNNFRVSLGYEVYRGRALDPIGGLTAYRREPNSEYYQEVREIDSGG